MQEHEQERASRSCHGTPPVTEAKKEKKDKKKKKKKKKEKEKEKKEKKKKKWSNLQVFPERHFCWPRGEDPEGGPPRYQQGMFELGEQRGILSQLRKHWHQQMQCLLAVV